MEDVKVRLNIRRPMTRWPVQQKIENELERLLSIGDSIHKELEVHYTHNSSPITTKINVPRFSKAIQTFSPPIQVPQSHYQNQDQNPTKNQTHNKTKSQTTTLRVESAETP